MNAAMLPPNLPEVVYEATPREPGAGSLPKSEAVAEPG